MKVYIMIPNAILVTYDAQEVILPTATGLIGVLDNHTSLMTSLESGTMLVREQNNEWSALAVFKGVAVIQKDYPFSAATLKVIQAPPPDVTCVVVLVTEAEFAKNLDPLETQEAYVLAQAELARASSKKEKILAAAMQDRARSRYQTTQTLPQK